MSDDKRSRWDARYRQAAPTPRDDGWIRTELEAIGAARPGSCALELGCGWGLDSAVLAESGYRVTASDLSPEAVALTARRVPAAQVSVVDIRDDLPWPDGVFDLVVASLCLHYFPWDTTETIMGEIARVLKPEGILVGRVNSTLDVHHGAGVGVVVEPGFYRHRGREKRFFTEDDVRQLLAGWQVLNLEAGETIRFRDPKQVIAFRAFRAH